MNPGAGDSGGDDGASDGRKNGKRELSTSKRAAQNRAAQVCDVCITVVRSKEFTFIFSRGFLREKFFG